ncbi:MAG: 3-methyl-2-oxobutanoate hydroxymethyltransferase [Oligoflexia bacterium]|nr:3-methyl-2-oxobutanoate hydroxymethyltransferase [Oligoflexia bacterium]
MTILDFKKMKTENKKISMVTCYDHWSAQIIAQTNIDCILVGDSLAMVVHGHPSTLQATTEMMTLHTAAVSRGAVKKFIVADMPFLTFRKGVGAAMECVEKLMQAGAHAVKLEGVDGHEDVVRQIVDSGVPVMGHLGLTPQSIHKFGGFKVQGKDDSAAQDIIRQASKLEELGCFSVVLECIPTQVATHITKTLSIPTIGIGAGINVDGQVLVLQDLLGMNNTFKPKFLKQYLKGNELLSNALNNFDTEVKNLKFPTELESYA